MGHYSSECPEKQKYKEIGQIWCNNCKKLGHYAATCPQETREELKLITCFNCKEQGHYASNCPEKMKNKINKPMKDLSLVTCAKCGNKGHHADDCPEKFPQDPKQAKMLFSLKIFKGGSTLDALSLFVTLAFPNLGTRFILRVVACHIPRFSKSCNVKNK